jgi:hypothetical protein
LKFLEGLRQLDLAGDFIGREFIPARGENIIGADTGSWLQHHISVCCLALENITSKVGAIAIGAHENQV